MQTNVLEGSREIWQSARRSSNTSTFALACTRGEEGEWKQEASGRGEINETKERLKECKVEDTRQCVERDRQTEGCDCAASCRNQLQHSILRSQDLHHLLLHSPERAHTSVGKTLDSQNVSEHHGKDGRPRTRNDNSLREK